MVLQALDPSELTSQQFAAIAGILAAPNLVSVEEARRLRTDRHFLLDCLYCEDAAIRSAALEQLLRPDWARSRLRPQCPHHDGRPTGGDRSIAGKIDGRRGEETVMWQGRAARECVR